MNDARTQAIHKAATELIEELVGSVSQEGGERWFRIIVRKMEQVPDRCPPKPPNKKLGLSFPGVRFDWNFASGGLDIASTDRPRKPLSQGYCGPEFDAASVSLSSEHVAKLKLWLNGE